MCTITSSRHRSHNEPRQPSLHSHMPHTHCPSLEHTVSYTMTHCPSLEHTVIYTMTYCPSLEHTVPYTMTYCPSLEHTVIYTMTQCPSLEYIVLYTMILSHTLSLEHIPYTMTQCPSLEYSYLHNDTITHTLSVIRIHSCLQNNQLTVVGSVQLVISRLQSQFSPVYKSVHRHCEVPVASSQIHLPFDGPEYHITHNHMT